MENVGRLVVTQTFLYSIALLTAALTIAIILDLFGIRRLARELRPYLYGTFFAGLLGLMLSYATDVLKTPAQIEAAVDGKIATATYANIALANDRTGEIKQSGDSSAPTPSANPSTATPLNKVTLYIQAATSEQKDGATEFVAAQKNSASRRPASRSSALERQRRLRFAISTMPMRRPPSKSPPPRKRAG